jgi:lipid A 3-O-deacylase
MFSMGERSRGALLRALAAAAVALLSRPGAAQTASPAADATAASPPIAYWVPLPPAPPGKIVDEVKAGVLAHDVGFFGHHVEHGPDVNLEVLFTAPDLLSLIGSPRPHIGADINVSGATSDAYVGLTWGITLIQNLFQPGDSVFADGSLGGAVQDGYELTAPDGHKRLGSPVLFRESAELGYQLTPTISMSGLLDHISNANLAPRNAGITSAGARVGFKF